MKLILLPIFLFISLSSFTQENKVKIETSDTSCIRILRNTFGCKEESNINCVFIFSFCNKARVATNLATKKEDIDYKIIKL